MLSVIFSPQCNKACICWHPFATFSAPQSFMAAAPKKPYMTSQWPMKLSQKNTVSMCCWLTTATTMTGSTFPFAFCLDELPAWGQQNWLGFHHPGDECYKKRAQLHWSTRPMKRLPKVHSFKLRLFLSWWSLPEAFTLNHIPVATQWRQLKSIKAQQ